VPFDIKCVIEGYLVTNFNKVCVVGRVGQKAISRPSADSFAFGRRQTVVSATELKENFFQVRTIQGILQTNKGRAIY
jgi:hypothetical protein